MNRQFLYDIYWKLESIIAPGLKYSQTIYEEVLNDYSKGKLRWLDLGCGHHLLPTWRIEPEKELINTAKLIVGIDYDYLSLSKHKTIKTKVRGNITELPFPENTFDLITSNMVFEHLDNPEKQLLEIRRVLSKGGILIFHTPNKISYATLMARMIPEHIKDKLVFMLQGRKEEDVFPAFYRINTPSEISKLAKSSGLNIMDLKMICSSAQFVIFPPIVILELIFIRFLMSNAGKSLRTNIIAILEKV